MKSTIVIVDALSTGNELADAFMARDCDVIHIWQDFSRKTRTEGFIKTINYSGSLESVIERLRPYNIDYVIAGSDSGIALADMLASYMKIKSANSSETTNWRRNKYITHQKLAEKNIRSIKQGKSSSISELIDWAEQQGYPVIVKPLNSGASDGVILCEDKKEVKRAAEKLLGKENLLGYVNEELLIQELIEGTQYFVNTLSWNGQHYVTDIWEQVRSRVREGAYNFEGMHLIDAQEEHAHSLIDYTFETLSALGVAYGAAHNEVILTSNGPVLIECNARLMGASINEPTFNACLGYTQASLCADMYLAPQKFINEYVGKLYKMDSYVSEISLLFKKNGVLVGMPGKDEIEKLSSFSNFFGLPDFKNYVKKTMDTKGLPGFVYLLHKEKEQVVKDFNQILNWQRQDIIYQIIERQ
ncbi:ATP-grasp domain-containing protein [Pantoea allii]|uniref:ATP-grasp domain-containing protein n=1 Tax=Pantoea allii TaxID=574096 RepID=UPI003D32082F